jgi:trehalose/maltose hydrolase-like predicted phosphorylase
MTGSKARSRTLDEALAPTADAGWVLTEVGDDPLREGSVETRFAISNGFLGVRGARVTMRGARWIVPARTYVAGLFDTDTGADAIPALVPAAGWLNINLTADGEPLAPHAGVVATHRLTLDMRRGVLFSESRAPKGDEGELGSVKSAPVKPGQLGLRVRTARLVSLKHRAIGLQLIQMDIDEGDVQLTLKAGCEGLGIGLCHGAPARDACVWRTRQSDMGLAMAGDARLSIDDEEITPKALGPLTWSWTWTTRPGQTVRFARLISLARSRGPGADVGSAARTALAAAQARGWRGVLADHEAAWAVRWRASEVTIDGDPAAQTALRFALYHLNGAANPDDELVSIGARALTGDDYLGHVFWDTEIYLVAFYALTWPQAARALLMYRFHTLDAARAKATRLGWRGALYAWESADTGAEAAPAQVIAPDRQVVTILCGTQEQHISADVAYAVWNYWRATGDDEFLMGPGAEIILETARFWVSRATLEADGHRHIRGVIGPDEYHETVDDNAFTNVMAQWNIRRGIDVAALMAARWPRAWSPLASRLKLDAVELGTWGEAADTIVTGRDPQTGLYEEFAGYFGLEDIDLAAYAGRSVPMDVVLGRERTQASQVIKQADVVALLALLPEAFTGDKMSDQGQDDAGGANFDYYAPRCGQGSSLSAVVHGLVAARLGKSEAALGYFRKTAAIDLADTKAADAGGVHIAALGGLWMMTVFGFAGLSFREDGVGLDPKLPPGWERLAFPIQWRGRRLRIEIDGARVAATLEAGEPMTVYVGGAALKLEGHGPVSAARPPPRARGGNKHKV